MVLMYSNAFCQVENSTRATPQEITINFDLLDLRGTLDPLSQNDKGMVVSDITPNQRHAIGELVGGDLAPDQRIFVLAYRPGVEPNEADKSVARSRTEEQLTKAHTNAHQQDLAPTEIEAAIAEAIQSTDQ